MSAEPPPVVAVSRSYRVLGRLDAGGMGEIFLARLSGPAGFEKDVVIKRMRPELASEPRFLAAFTNEARLLAQINHPNVCQVYDLVSEGDDLYLAMEYLDGLPLGIMMRAAGGIEIRKLLGIAHQLCEGLAHVHLLRRPDGTPSGVVHRDISPQNLFLTVTGTAKILDFGIAETYGPAESAASDFIIGKLAYMSPEQRAGRPLDRRSDLYSLGVVLKEAADRAEATSPILEPVLRRALAERREERFPCARAMQAAIDEAAARAGGVASAAELAGWLASFSRELADRRSWATEAVTGAEGRGHTTLRLPAPTSERFPLAALGRSAGAPTGKGPRELAAKPGSGEGAARARLERPRAARPATATSGWLLVALGLALLSGGVMLARATNPTSAAVVASLTAATRSPAVDDRLLDCGDGSSAAFRGVGPLDLVSRSELLRPDGSPDAVIDLTVCGSGTVESITIHYVSGLYSIWDTIPGNGLWTIGVADARAPATLLNRADGSVEFSAPRAVVLYLEDNRSISEGKTTFEARVRFTNGRSETTGVALPASWLWSSTRSDPSSAWGAAAPAAAR